MAKRVKRWKVSDIVRAALGMSEARYVAFVMRGGSLAEGLGYLNSTLPRACNVEEYHWQRMTHKRRCDALVATAKRLGVPRRA